MRLRSLASALLALGVVLTLRQARAVEPQPGATALAGQPVVAYVLEGIDVVGNRKTRSDVIREAVGLKPGQLIDAQSPAIELARLRLEARVYLEKVTFALSRGSRPGTVRLLVTVQERSSWRVDNLWMGISADADTEGNARPLTPYGGVALSDTNFFGTGTTVGGAYAVAQDQTALQLRYLDPNFMGPGWMGTAELRYTDGLDFFGNQAVEIPSPTPDQPEDRDFAVLRYQRAGAAAGLGWEFLPRYQLWTHYRWERVSSSFPEGATHQRGEEREPIDFLALPGISYLNTVRLGFEADHRDHPLLPQRGTRFRSTLEWGLPVVDPSYSFQRADLQYSSWHPLGAGQTIGWEVYGGAMFGEAPFFEHYYIGDFSDFLAGRLLGLSVERRPAPNFLGTAIAEVRRGTFAARANAEYRTRFYRGSRSIFAIDGFVSGGLFFLAAPEDLTNPASGYDGWAQVPVDLTANFGLRFDTSAGVISLSFSNIIGFVPMRGSSQ